MSLNDYFVLGAVAAFSLAINLPFGHLRSKAKRYSLRWFLCIHLPIPFIYFLRKILMVPGLAIPLIVVAAVLGQVWGGKLIKSKDG